MKIRPKVVILGSNSFVISELIPILKSKKINYLGITRKQIDLTKKSSEKK